MARCLPVPLPTYASFFQAAVHCIYFARHVGSRLGRVWLGTLLHRPALADRGADGGGRCLDAVAAEEGPLGMCHR